MAVSGLSRRKYAALTKLFTKIMQDPKESPKTRFAAACRLDDLLARADARVDRAAERLHRQQLAAMAAGDPKAAARAAADAGKVNRALGQGILPEAADAEDLDDEAKINAAFDAVLGGAATS